MVSEDEMLVLSHLRQNARKNLTKISKETGFPVSTIFDKLRRYERESIIKRHTALLDFSKLGYEIKVHMPLKVPREYRDELKNYLLKEPVINSVYRINNGYDFLIEAFFRSIKDVNDFVEGLERFRVKATEEYFVLEEIKKEAFMADPEMVKIYGV